MRRMLQIAIFNDSLYMSKHQIIDYSLFLVINPLKRTVRVGIIDYVRHYNFREVIEQRFKETMSKEAPTVINPEQYKRRFRAAMDKYFISLVPDANCDLPTLVASIANKNEEITVERKL
jgi:1-phosphatidylinositol-3-phosphate 5-kinase